LWNPEGGVVVQNQLVRVLVVDDHTILRDALATFFETCDDLMLAGEAGNGQEAIAACQALQPDVVLMDLLMPVMDGVTATRIIHEQYPHIKVLVLTSLADGVQIQQALEAGASACLLKNASTTQLVDKVLEVAGKKPPYVEVNG
jgi:NarL family two-component system response regulator LiaR